jgi:hypothetical protein
VEERPPRNPFRSEADAFRVLMMFVAAGVLVIAVALLISSLVAVLVAAVLLAIGGWRAWGLLQTWRREGSDPDPEARARSGPPSG